MTVDVLAPSYDSAAAALIDVNHDAAVLYADLTSALQGCAAMAGDDSTSTDFTASYDEQAQCVVDVLRDLVDAAGNLGVLAATSIENHRRADAGAAYTAAPLLHDGCAIPIGTGEVDVEAFAVPGSEGGDGGGMPEFFDVIVDHVQGVVWPNADTDRLRVAGAAWRTAAGTLDLLDDGCHSAVDLLSEQRSPEITLALTAVRELKDSASDLADACRSLATACDDYAQEVDDRRDEIKDIVKQLAIEAGATAVVGGLLSLVSAGLTGALAVAAIGARAATYGARILTVLAKLRTAVRLGPLATLGTAGAKAAKVSPILRRLAGRTRRGRGGFGHTLGRQDLNASQLANLRRYSKKLPAGAQSTVITRAANGGVALTTKVPGRVPGSYATYEKVLDAAGETLAYTKTTVLPDGKIAHVKDKLRP